MCGIAGYFGTNEINKNHIYSTSKKMKNRGPDNFDYKVFNINKNNIFFLHSRLSIIELSKKANQPYEYKDKVLIFNGEIYNYIELRERLENKGVKFNTNSDTEVLIKCLDYYGEKTFALLEGMWSFVFLDKSKEKLILSRDRFGEKPLYFKKNNDGIYFGSETKFIENLSNIKEDINENKINNFLRFGFGSVFYDNKTFLRNIYAVEPGQNLIITKNFKIKKKKFWSLENIKKINKVNYDNEINHIKRLLINSVKIRLRSDVRNVFSLSGGIDSGALVSISKKELKCKTNTYSIISKDKKYNEIEFLDETIKDTKVKKNPIKLKKINFFKNIKSIIQYFNSPLLTINYIPLSKLLSKIKKANYKVLITGNGSDEIFAGYYDHFIFHLLDLKKKNKKYKTNLDFWKKTIVNNLRNKKLRNIENIKSFELFNVNDNYSHFFTKRLKNKFKFKKIYKSKLKNNLVNQLKERLYPSMYQDDLISMKYSIENRSPFLDKKLAEKVFSIPSEYMIKNGFSKNLLRDCLKNVLNDKVRMNRKKIGFNASLISFSDINKKNIYTYLSKNFSYINKFIKKDAFFLYFDKLDLRKLSDDDQKFIFRILSVITFLKIRKKQKI